MQKFRRIGAKAHADVKKIENVQIFPSARFLWLFYSQGGFEPSQPQRIISGLRETFIKRYMVERTNKAELRPEEQIEKAESCRENLWNEIRSKGT